MRPTNADIAWQPMDFPAKGLKLYPQYTKSSGAPPQEYLFDEVLTGSDNKPVYNAVARSHVTAAMEGYNAVVFAYGQTASGKTFTLVRPAASPGSLAMLSRTLEWRRRPARYYSSCYA
jgi:centromeric protein E